MVPVEIRELAQEIVASHPSEDAQEQKRLMVAASLKIKNRAALVESMWRHACEDAVDEARCRHNAGVRRFTGFAATKVAVASSVSVRQVARESLLCLFIGGRMLRDYLGAELPALAAGEHAQARSHRRLAQFLESLADVVPANMRVGEVVSEERARAIYLGQQLPRAGRLKKGGVPATA